MRSDEELFEMYRFCRPTIFFFCNLIENRLRYKTIKCSAFSPRGQLLMFLGFVASGAFRQLIVLWSQNSLLGDELGGGRGGVGFLRPDKWLHKFPQWSWSGNFTASQVHWILLQSLVIYLKSYQYLIDFYQSSEYCRQAWGRAYKRVIKVRVIQSA